MSGEKTKVTVDIYGMQYKLAGKESSGHLHRVADLVDAQMHKIAKGFPKLDLPRVAVLAAVNIADDYLKQREQFEQQSQGLENNMSEEYKELSTTLDALQQEHQAKLTALSAAEQREEELRQQLEQLQEEYTKLQNEYNEWIQLVQSEEPNDSK